MIIEFSLVCTFCLINLRFLILKGKGASLGVGRGRAVAMRAKVSCSLQSLYLFPILSIEPFKNRLY